MPLFEVVHALMSQIAPTVWDAIVLIQRGHILVDDRVCRYPSHWIDVRDDSRLVSYRRQ